MENRRNIEIKESHLLSVVVALAVIVRVGVALIMGNDVYELPGIQDQISYDTLAQRLLSGQGYSFPAAWYPFTPPDTPTAHWSFIYPAWLALIYKTIGYYPLVARVLQATLVGIASTLLIYRLAYRLFRLQVAIIAASLAAVYTYFVYYSAALMTEAFFMVMALGAIELAYEIRHKPTLLRISLLGIVFGAGILLRQTLLFFFPVVLLWLWWHARQRISAVYFVLLVSIPILFILPFSVRNYTAYGRFLLLNSNSGYALYSSSHPNVGYDWTPENSVNPLPEGWEGSNEAELDALLMGEGIRFILVDPQRYAVLTLSKFKEYYKFWSSPESSWVSNIQRPLSFGWLLPLSLLGLYLARTQWREWLLPISFVVTIAVVHLLTWPTARYRVPTDACLIPFAALSITWFIQWIRASRIGEKVHAHPLRD